MDDTFDITYKALFRRYYPNLMFYATRLVGDEEAEDVVQDVFVELWKRRDSMVIGDQIQAANCETKSTKPLTSYRTNARKCLS